VIVEFLSHGGGIESYDHGTFASPQSLGGAKGAKPIASFSFCKQLTVLRDIERLKILGAKSGQVLGKIGGIGSYEMNLLLAVNQGQIVLGVHALVENEPLGRGAFFLACSTGVPPRIEYPGRSSVWQMSKTAGRNLTSSSSFAANRLDSTPEIS